MLLSFFKISSVNWLWSENIAYMILILRNLGLLLWSSKFPVQGIHIHTPILIYILYIISFHIYIYNSLLYYFFYVSINVCLTYLLISEESMLKSLATYTDKSISLYHYAIVASYTSRLYC